MNYRWLFLQVAYCLLLDSLIGDSLGLRLRGEPLVGLASANKRSTNHHRNSPTGRIIGGENALVANAPWTVSIENHYYYHFCGGAIVNESYVLTAASCVAGLQPKTIRVLTGTTNWWNDENPEYLVDQVILHCNFDRPLYHNDIALLKLKTEIQLNDVTKIVPLAELDELQPGDKLTFTGWGSTAIGEDYPQNLKKLDGSYMSYESCKSAYGGSNDVDLGHVCVDRKLGEGICHGDTGGPLVNTNAELVGISNWGVPCGFGFPDCFARVAFYNDWIRTTINGCGNAQA